MRGVSATMLGLALGATAAFGFAGTAAAQQKGEILIGEQCDRTGPTQIVGVRLCAMDRPRDDLAVVRIQPFANMTVAQIGDSSRLVVGQEVMAIGNPLGITETATKGIVSALNRSVTESTGTTVSNAIQTDTAVNPGNSGGALINLQGQLIGIPTLIAVNTESNTAANGVSFAIPSNLVQTVVQQILQQ